MDPHTRWRQGTYTWYDCTELVLLSTTIVEINLNPMERKPLIRWYDSLSQVTEKYQPSNN
jgi:hypothetical protein